METEDFDCEKNYQFVIERILNLRNEKSVKWMLEHFAAEKIVEIVKKSKNIDRKSANFWAFHFRISKRNIECFKNSYQKNI